MESESPFVHNYPAIRIDRSSPDGNAHVIMGIVQKVLISGGRQDLCAKYISEATSSTYEHLCNVSKKYINIRFKD